MLDRTQRPDDPKEWLNRAKSNLIKAKALNGRKDVYLEDLCFDLQQSAEKALKAVLIQNGIKFPKSHDLTDLMSLLEAEGLSIPEEVKKGSELTEYAVETRYPGWSEPVTQSEYEQAVTAAEIIFEWAKQIVNK